MKVGSIRLGATDKPVSKNLLEAGYELVVLDFNEGAVKEVMECGAVSAASGREVTEQYEVVITMVPNSPHVHAAVLDENGVTDGTKSGMVLIDISSTDPTESKAVGAELVKGGIDILDVPTSGGEPKAIDGMLSVMVDGRKELFDRYYDMLVVTAGSVVYVDELGSDNVAKLASQIAVAVNIATVSEALTFAKKAGADPELVYQAIRDGFAGSTVTDAKTPMMLSRNFKPGFRIELHIRDLNNVLSAAHATSSPAPLTGRFMEITQGLRADGYGKGDHVGIVKYYEEIANTIVES